MVREITNLVEFPELGLSLNISNVAFSIFGIDIYWYGLIIGIGMMLGVLVAFKLAPSFGVDSERMVDVIVIGFICAIVGARLYYVAFSGLRYESLWDVVNLRDGGLAIYGGIIGGMLGAGFACKWRKVPILPQLDLVAYGFLVGQSIGRWGNFFNQEAFGDTTTGLLGMRSASTVNYLMNVAAPRLAQEGIYVDPYAPVHPTFLYESLWCALGFVLLYLYRKHRRFNGEILLLYVVWYGLGRFVIEGMRTDSLMVPIVNLRVSQVLALASAVVALAVWGYIRYKRRGKPLVVPEIPPHTARVRLSVDEGEQIVEISWPAIEKAPTKERRLEMAQEALRKQKAKGEAQGETSAQEASSSSKKDKADAEAKDTSEEQSDGTEKAKDSESEEKKASEDEKPADTKEDEPPESSKEK